MFLTRSEYDRGINTFSPDGRLFQVEYAIEAIKMGSTVIGLRTKDCVVLAVEKRIASTLMESSSIEKVYEIDKHIACAMSGLTADARTMIDRARVEAQNFWFTYNEPMPVESVVQSICNLAMSRSRPYGVALLVAGIDVINGQKVPLLYETDPSGTFTRHDAKAIGSGFEGAQTALQESYHTAITFDEAVKLALTTLKQVMEEKLSSSNVEVAVISVVEGFRILNKEQVEAVVQTLEA